MALVFQIVMMALYLVRGLWGHSGVYVSAAVLGLTDVDALTVSMARGIAGSESLDVAAAAIAIGVLTNTFFKAMLAAFIGTPAFRGIAAGTLTTMTVAGVIGFII
jgi:uncharacterized membrane protein (DUF4010 family)